MAIVAGTGSRSLAQEPWEARQRVKVQIEEHLMKQGAGLIVMSGMAEGFDELLAEVAIERGFPLWCAVPNKGYGHYYWGKKSQYEHDREHVFQKYLDLAYRVTYIMEDVHNVTGLYLNGQHSNFVRNDFMVAEADEFLVYNPWSPGTRQCFARIKKGNKPYTIVGT